MTYPEILKEIREQIKEHLCDMEWNDYMWEDLTLAQKKLDALNRIQEDLVEIIVISLDLEAE